VKLYNCMGAQCRVRDKGCICALSQTTCETIFSRRTGENMTGTQYKMPLGSRGAPGFAFSVSLLCQLGFMVRVRPLGLTTHAGMQTGYFDNWLVSV